MINIKQLLKSILFILVINIALFIFIEGLASTLLSIKYVFSSTEKDGEEVHTKFDELLGWANLPNYENKNLFGPGLSFKTNSQSFRAKKDFTADVPKGKIRIICSGDSFTLGYGIDDEHTWSEELNKINKKIETVNLGQVGYGIDQAYLWYMRDGRKFDHNIHIFAFITEDLYRMNMDKFSFYKKPIFKLVNNELVIKNTPLHRYSPLTIKLKECIANLEHFRFYTLIQGAERNIYSLNNDNSTRRDDKELRKIILKIFETLNKVNKEKNSKLVLVYLPEYLELCNYADSEKKLNIWRDWFKTEMSKRGILFIDLTRDFKDQSLNELKSLYLEDLSHYSNKGNKFVAQILYKRLKILNSDIFI